MAAKKGVARGAQEVTQLCQYLNATTAPAIIPELLKRYPGTDFSWQTAWGWEGLEVITAELARLPKAVKYTAVVIKEIVGVNLVVRKDVGTRMTLGDVVPIPLEFRPRAETLVRRAEKKPPADLPPVHVRSVWEWLKNPGL